MSTITIIDLNTDKALDKAALSKILGGTGMAYAGDSMAYAGKCKDKDYSPCWPKKTPHCPTYGPRAFQLSYNTSSEESYYKRYDQSLNLSYFQA